MTKKNDQILAIFKAWNDAGVNPYYHETWKDKIRRDWPVLAKALDGLDDPTPVPSCLVCHHPVKPHPFRHVPVTNVYSG